MGAVPGLWALASPSIVEEAEAQRGRLTRKQTHTWPGDAESQPSAVSDTTQQSREGAPEAPRVRKAGLGPPGS